VERQDISVSRETGFVIQKMDRLALSVDSALMAYHLVSLHSL
jgi:hypothetical protein